MLPWHLQVLLPGLNWKTPIHSSKPFHGLPLWEPRQPSLLQAKLAPCPSFCLLAPGITTAWICIGQNECHPGGQLGVLIPGQEGDVRTKQQAGKSEWEQQHSPGPWGRLPPHPTLFPGATGSPTPPAVAPHLCSFPSLHDSWCLRRHFAKHWAVSSKEKESYWPAFRIPRQTFLGFSLGL